MLIMGIVVWIVVEKFLSQIYQLHYYNILEFGMPQQTPQH